VWSLFVFDLSKESDVVKKCDVVEEWVNAYFYISICYFSLNILIPMIIVVILNCLIIYKTKKDDLNRIKYTFGNMRTNTLNSTRRNALKNLVDIKASIKQIKDKKLTKKMSKTLALASFSFVVLNLPYAIMW